MKSRMGGYTVLEALIFLAVSGILFAVVYPTFAGRDNKTKFSQSVRDLESKINDVGNDVTTGYYPSSDVQCRVNPGLPDNIQLGVAGGNDKQGARQDCIFVGKVLRFGDDSSPSEVAKMDIITLVGKRMVNKSKYPVNIAEATPTAVVSPVDLTETHTLVWGVPITSVKVLDGSPTPPDTATIAIMTKLANSSVSANTKNVDLFTVASSNSITQSRNDAASLISSNTWTAPHSQGFLVCLDSPYSDEKAAIKVSTGSASFAKAIFSDSTNTQEQDDLSKC